MIKLEQLAASAMYADPGRRMGAGTAARMAATALFASLSCAVSGSVAARAASLDIQPMTHVDVGAHTGYMSDPYPIRQSLLSSPGIQLLSGTTAKLLTCSYPITAGCFTSTDDTVDTSSLKPQIAAAGMQFLGIQNRDIFQDNNGNWHMAVGIDFGPDKAHKRTLIAHASPDVKAAPGSAPTSWSVDRLLVGSFSNLDQGNYDCKYFEDKGQLYLLYVKNLQPDPLVNGIVIQPMQSPTMLAPVGPVLLLSPDQQNGGFSSEQFASTTSKLVEAENIQVINGKYAMAYSTGSFLTAGYKAGVAWSDTLFPAPGHEYRKVLEADDQDVWHDPSRVDVHYLMQSQQADWPNYTGGQVIGPGVSSFVRGPGGGWYMYLNAYDPGDMPTTPSEGDHRRPYFVHLQVDVPLYEPVAAASDADLAQWIVPEAR